MPVSAKRTGMVVTVLAMTVLLGQGCGTTPTFDTTNAWLLSYEGDPNTGIMVIENNALTKWYPNSDGSAGVLLADGQQHTNGSETYTLTGPVTQDGTKFRLNLTLIYNDTKTVSVVYEGAYETAAKITGTATAVTSTEPSSPKISQFALEKM